MFVVVAIATLILLLRADPKPTGKSPDDASAPDASTAVEVVDVAADPVVVPMGDTRRDPEQDALPTKAQGAGGCPDGLQLTASTQKGIGKETGCVRAVDGSFVKEGRWVFIDEQGVELSGELVGGKKEGKWLTWYPNGTVAKSEEFHADQFDGLQIEWSPTGARTAEREYKDGRLDGRVTLYLDDGSVVHETWKEGRRIDPPDHPSLWPADAG